MKYGETESLRHLWPKVTQSARGRGKMALEPGCLAPEVGLLRRVAALHPPGSLASFSPDLLASVKRRRHQRSPSQPFAEKNGHVRPQSEPPPANGGKRPHRRPTQTAPRSGTAEPPLCHPFNFCCQDIRSAVLRYGSPSK